MNTYHTLAAVVLAAALGSLPVQAAPLFTVTASFDPFVTGNTSFAITNTSGLAETGVDLVSGSAMQLLGSLAAGATLTYAFNQVSGPFLVEPGPEGVLDTTVYRVTATVGSQSVSTAGFSPVSNATGGYVDFLGACYEASVGCSVDPTVNYSLSGLVASASAAPVPAPPALWLMASGLVSLTGLRRRRRDTFNIERGMRIGA